MLYHRAIINLLFVLSVAIIFVIFESKADHRLHWTELHLYLYSSYSSMEYAGYCGTVVLYTLLFM